MLLTESEERQSWQCIKVTEVKMKKMKLGEWRKEKEEKSPVQPELNQQLSVDITCFQIQMPLFVFPFSPCPFCLLCLFFLFFQLFLFLLLLLTLTFVSCFSTFLHSFFFLSCFPLGYFFS